MDQVGNGVDDSIEAVAAAVSKLDRSTEWRVVSRVPLDFAAFHPQGLTRVGDRLFLSSVEIIEAPERFDRPRDGHDRSAGRGRGHLFEMDGSGRLLREVELGARDMYHPGGIDFDGEVIWVSVSEYRPDSRCIVYRVDPESMEATEAFRFDDHLGGIVLDRATRLLHAVTWGARRLLTLRTDGYLIHTAEHVSKVIDHQGCVCAGGGRMVATGVTEYPTSDGGIFQLGGIAVLDTWSGLIEHEVPVVELSPQRRVVTFNAVHLETEGAVLRMLAVPDDGGAVGDSSLLVLEAKPVSDL